MFSQSGPPAPRSRKKESVPVASVDMLSDIAWLGEEYLRTSREKVSITQTIHDSVGFFAFLQQVLPSEVSNL